MPMYQCSFGNSSVTVQGENEYDARANAHDSLLGSFREFLDLDAIEVFQVDGMLEKGKQYDLRSLRFVEWNQAVEGYNFYDYFSADGTYLGADQHGIEPIVESV